jgi:hypothetical protein
MVHLPSGLNATSAGRAAIAAAQDRELTRVLAHLASGGISPILIKGAHLAHTIYPSSASRPRGDTDMVIAAEEEPLVAALLQNAGYSRLVHVRGTLILGQCHFDRIDGLGVVHALDVHWRLAAPLVFRHVLPAATLRASRVAIPALGPHAWGPSRPHALLIACVHLIAHHRTDPIPLWLHDIALLADGLGDDERRLFFDTAEAAGILSVCAAALDRARREFDAPALALLEGRARAGAASRTEPSARLLAAKRPIDELWLDLRTADGWYERLTLLREHLFPDAAYVRARAPDSWLPLAYARRAGFGIRKWTARPGADR